MSIYIVVWSEDFRFASEERFTVESVATKRYRELVAEGKYARLYEQPPLRLMQTNIEEEDAT